MSDLVAELAAQGLALSAEERVRLLDLLLESLQQAPPGANEEAWSSEVARRVTAHDRGEGRLYELDEVMTEAARIAP